MEFNSTPLISIIVPAYNCSQTIEETLSSIKQQTYINWECIIVNDGSTDATENIIKSIITDDKRFNLFITENKGVSSAKNYAIHQSQGEYLFPLDSDDLIKQDCLETCINEFRKNKDIVLVYTDVEFFGEKSGLFNLMEYKYETLLKQNLMTNSSMFRKESFLSVGGYRTNMIHGFEDWDFYIALLFDKPLDAVKKVPEPLMLYRIQEKSRSRSLETENKMQQMYNKIIYNNFNIYCQYYPNLFQRIQEYDYLKTMISKPIIKQSVSIVHLLSSIKKMFLK
ncbi:MAG: glycosyltransferase family A protein [Prolixibacteraceae bacterium]|jgi:glycosyltransferase involved in cell wall biosynthesis|nr:glycosyltransferase family A protein [Prolixibacteraceae bacterium]